MSVKAFYEQVNCDCGNLEIIETELKNSDAEYVLVEDYKHLQSLFAALKEENERLRAWVAELEKNSK